MENVKASEALELPKDPWLSRVNSLADGLDELRRDFALYQESLHAHLQLSHEIPDLVPVQTEQKKIKSFMFTADQENRVLMQTAFDRVYKTEARLDTVNSKLNILANVPKAEVARVWPQWVAILALAAANLWQMVHNL